MNVLPRLRWFGRAYLEGRWLAAGLALWALLLFGFTLWVGRSAWLASGFFHVYMVSLLGLLIAAVHQGLRKKMRRAAWSGFCLLALCPLNPLVAVLIMVAGMFSSAEDDFGKDLVIPPDLAMEEPVNQLTNFWPEAIRDEEGRAILQAAAGTTNGSLIEADTEWLRVLDEPARDQLLRHLASSARWRVTREGEQRVAFRRAAPDGVWRISLNGYYTDFDFDRSNGSFQYRVLLGLDGPALDAAWERMDRRTVMAAGGGSFSLEAKANPKMPVEQYESYLVVTGPVAAVEIFEQRPTTDRAMTCEALRQLALEMGEPGDLAEGSLRRGEPALGLANGSQGGIYDLYGFINPGEAGYLYVKAFEVTQGTPLSARRLKEDSLEYTGWSDDPGEQFFWNAHIMIGEGDWGTFYPARFEVWFVPASGAPERKLMEKVFRIQGWMR